MRKGILIIILVLSLLIVGCSAKSSYNEFAYDFDPELGQFQDIEEFFEEFFYKRLQMSPERATWMGEYDGYEVNRQDHKLTDISYEFMQKEIDFYKNSLEILLSFDERNLTQDQKFSRSSFVWFLNMEIEKEEYLYHDYLTNHFNGIATNLISSLERDHHINSLEDAENYIKRLEAFPWKLGNLSEGINKQWELGITPPDIILRKFSAYLHQIIKSSPRSNSLYTTFVTKLEQCDDISKEEKVRLRLATIDALQNHVYPAYNKLLDQTVVPYVKDATKESVSSGIWELPQGDEYYAYLIRKFTTTNLTPQEIHDMGLREVERINGEIRGILDEMGYQGENTRRTLEKIGNGNMVVSRNNILNEYRNVVEEIEGVMPELFNTLPKGPVFVEPVPDHREATFTHHYAFPSRDGNRPGTFYVNLSYPHPRKSIKALAFHEALPGHHLQIAIQTEANLPMFRDTILQTAFAEGWALYAEKLMYEHGYYGDLLSELGYLESELFRAIRLVVDTGIHYKKWTREEAIQYFYDNTGSRNDREVDRYIVWPGQALAYKVGELKILELRDLAMEQLGDEFDLKEFHDVILLTGSVPLDILEEEVVRYIKEKQK